MIGKSIVILCFSVCRFLVDFSNYMVRILSLSSYIIFLLPVDFSCFFIQNRISAFFLLLQHPRRVLHFSYSFMLLPPLFLPLLFSFESRVSPHRKRFGFSSSSPVEIFTTALKFQQWFIIEIMYYKFSETTQLILAFVYLIIVIFGRIKL